MGYWDREFVNHMVEQAVMQPSTRRLFTDKTYIHRAEVALIEAAALHAKRAQEVANKRRKRRAA
jgi:hypothetical protein